MKDHDSTKRGTEVGCNQQRRRFLRGATGALAAASAVALTPAAGKADWFDFDFGFHGDGNSTIDVNARANFVQIRADETAHVNALGAAIAALISGGATGPAATPTFQNLTVNNRRQFLTTAQTIENAVLGGYALALTSVFNSPTTQALVTAIGLDEGRHAGFANVVAGSLLSTNSLGPNNTGQEAPLTVTQINTAVGGYIATGGAAVTGFTVPTAGTPPSADTDVSILNLLLTLELLEQAFFGTSLSGNVRTIFHA